MAIFSIDCIVWSVGARVRVWNLCIEDIRRILCVLSGFNH